MKHYFIHTSGAQHGPAEKLMWWCSSNPFLLAVVQLTVRCLACDCGQTNAQLVFHIVINAKQPCSDRYLQALHWGDGPQGAPLAALRHNA